MKRTIYVGLFSLLVFALGCGLPEDVVIEEYLSNDNNEKSSDYSREAIAHGVPGLASRTTESIVRDRLSPFRTAEPTRLALVPELVPFEANTNDYESYDGQALAADFAPGAPAIAQADCGPGLAAVPAIPVPVVPAVPVMPTIAILPPQLVPVPALPALSPPVAEFLAGVRDVPPWKANYVNSYGQLPSRVGTGGPFLYSYTVRP